MSQSGEKTEKATSKKRRDAREKGQVLKSTEVNAAVSLVCMFGALKMLTPYLSERVISFMTRYLNGDFTLDVDILDYQNMYPIIVNIAYDSLMILLPVLGVALLSGLFVNYMQVGFLFSSKALAPKFSRINPMQGFKRIFSTRSLTELVKSILKVVILGKIVYDEYVKNVGVMSGMIEMPISMAIGKIIDSILWIGLKAGGALLVLAAADFLYQWWSFEKDLRMSKQEIKDEYKTMEGDPQVKNKIRQKQRQMGMMRMMQAVPDADVVITNPTHYAVALKYEEGDMSAPVVIAKGKDLVAKKIREIAGEHKIRIVENRPVAQGLFFFCEVGDPIPETMYQAVAEILALVYKARAAATGGTR